MNRTYRHVWSKAQGRYVVAAETASSCRGGSASSSVAGAVAVTLGIVAFPAFGQIVPTGSGNTEVFRAPNGVQVVNINTANGAGLSHNRYTQYNVETTGVVLNNANSVQMTRNSVLAGQVTANLNLVQEARVILNEVVSNNRSVLRGFTEVLGSKADVVLANPWGITCSGCGYINVDRAVLTTGVPQIGNTGSLDAFRVTMGDILVTGTGMDATGPRLLDLVARSIKIDGRVTSTDFGITTGANTWTWDTRSATPIAGDGAAPSFAFDSTVLGGMYANRIRIVATEAGVGVRMLGEVAASGDDFNLDSAGKVVLNNRISAQRDLAINQTTQTGADAVTIAGAGASLSAGRDLMLASAAGGLTLSDAMLKATGNLSIQAKSLADTTSDATVGRRAADGSVTVSVDGNAAITSSSWQSGSNMLIDAGSVTVGTAGATIAAGTNSAASDKTLVINANSGDIDLSTAKVTGASQVTVDAKQGGVAIGGDGTNADQTVAAAGDLTIKAASTLVNTGKVGSQQDVIVRANDSGQTLAITNSGTVQADRHLDIAGSGNTPDRNVTLNNQSTGLLAAAGNLQLRGTQLTNAGTMQGATAVGLTLNGTASNTATGKILSDTSGAALQVTASGIDNAGTLQSKGALSLTATNGITQASTGRIVTVASSQGGSNGNMTLNAADVTNQGLASSAGQLSATASNTVANSGDLQAVGDITLDAGQSVTQASAGKTIGDAAVTVRTAALDNSGRVQAGTALAVGQSAARTAVENRSGGVLLGNTSTVYATNLNNSGTVQSTNGSTLNTSLALTNASGGQLILSTGGSPASSTLQVGTTLTNAGTASATGAAVVTANALSNSGSLSTQGNLTSTVAGALTNSGTLQSGAVLDSTSASVSNTSTAKVIAGGNLNVKGSSNGFNLTNAGLIQSGGTLAVGESARRAALTNQSGGTLRGDAFTLYGTNVTNAGGGRMQWNKAGTVNVTSLTNSASNSVIVGSLDGTPYASAYTVSGALTNNGAIHSGGDQTINAGALYNSSTAGISALQDVSATVTQSTNGASEALRNEGAFYAGRNLALSAASGTLINAGTTGTLDAGGNITATALNLTNQNSIRANNITVTGTNSFLNQPSGGLPTIYLDESPVSSVAEHAINNQEYNCNIFGAACDGHVTYERSVTLRERLSGPMPSVKPQILATNTLNVNYGAGGGANQAGILSANTINIAGSGTFTNQDFHLDEISYAYRRVRVEIDCTFCSESFTNYYPANNNQFNQVPGNNGDHITWGGAGQWSGGSTTFRQERTRSTYYTSGAGIFAVTINFSGGTLVNRGSPQNATPTSRSTSGTSADGTTVNASSGVSSTGLQSVTPTAGVTLNGITISLPTNPNGYFVVSQNPNAGYLVETNPLFAVGTDFVGSSYMTERLKLNPDAVQKRLGDANYEAQLIRQQLIAQTGRNLLNQAESEASQMKRLMDNSVNESSKLGLVYGKAPTPEQLARLTGDIVWMVETVVAGQKVLAPVVYLSQATKEALEGNSTAIAGTNVNIDAQSLENTGGTIEGSGKLAIATKGDITNTSGTIKGGDVSLKSTEGSIVNKTLATTAGDDYVARTNIGKTAGIQATGSLSMDAKKDISIVGANVSAGKDASLSAGGNVTVDTIVDKTANSSSASVDLLLIRGTSNRTEITEKNIGSNLNIGNNLTIKSGGDTTIAGSNAKVGGDLNVDAAGSFKVEARQDKSTVRTDTTVSGLGVGGGLAGKETTTKEDFKGTNAGSTLQVGGNAKVDAGKDMTIQGSDVKIAGSADIKAKDGINVLDGLNETRSTTHVETTTIGKIGGSAAAQADADAKNGAGRSASAKASASASSEIKLVEKSVTDTVSGSKTSVASNLQVGGNLNMQTDGTLKVQGSNVEAGGNLNADAKNIEVLAGRNETYSSSKTESKSIGIYSDAGAGASASANQTGTNATAGAKAEAKGVTTIGGRTETSESDSYSLKNTGSTLKSGGNMTLTAKEEAKFQGADVQAKGNIDVKAKDITSLAAQDIETSSSSMTQRTAGVYVGANAGANASAGNGSAGAGASAEASAGLRYNDKSTSESAGSTTANTTSFKAGGDVTRTAQGTITDQGTQIEAGGNIKQSAKEIKEIEAKNTTYATSSSSSNDARIGVYAGAGASASTSGGAGADASIGVKASYEGSKTSESESSSTAVTSRYKAGGSIDSSSSGKTTLLGTQMEAGKDVNLSAGSLDYQAARDTSSKSSSSLSGSVDAKVGLIGTAGVNVNGAIDASGSSSSSSTARAGGITSGGGNINITTKGDASFEGTDMKAGKGGVSVDAGGNVDFKAARSTSESSEYGVSASVSVGTSGGGGGKSSEKSGSVGVGVTAGGSSSDIAKASNIEAGSGGVTIKAGNNATLEGTQVKSGGDATVQAGGQVVTKEAVSRSSEYGVSAGFSAAGSGGGKGSDGKNSESKSGGGVGFGAEGGSSSSSQGVSIQAAGEKKVTSGARPQAAAPKKPTAPKKAPVKPDNPAAKKNANPSAAATGGNQPAAKP